MVRRGMFGHFLNGLFAESAISYNRFVKRGSTDKYVVQATAEADAIGIAEIDNRLLNLDGSERTGWVAHEPVPVKAKGSEAVLELGGTVLVDEYIKSDANGKGVKYSFTDAGSTFAEAELQAAIDTIKVVKARALEGGESGDLIRVLIL